MFILLNITIIKSLNEEGEEDRAESWRHPTFRECVEEEEKEPMRKHEKVTSDSKENLGACSIPEAKRRNCPKKEGIVNNIKCYRDIQQDKKK